MTQLLVSVRDMAEAELAFACRVNYLDIKEPTLGSLGAAPEEVRRAIASKYAGKIPLSAAAGELFDWESEQNSAPNMRSHSVELSPETTKATPWNGYSWAKIGLARCREIDWRSAWLRWQATLPQMTRGVLVCYADARDCLAPQPAELLQFALETQVPALTIDTFNKNGPGLCQIWSHHQLQTWAAKLKQSGILSVAAGKLQFQDLRTLQLCGFDVAAVRGGVCKTVGSGNRSPRTGLLEWRAVMDWRIECEGTGAENSINSLSTDEKSFINFLESVNCINKS
ncbi:MAG: (5-formylfuran-3-yl)methyl phosphate synthase [Pirellulales bacterium]|nr:(5-formylfuran-3-yl)methyl phosphate synthase [Pirellulales bacterium]